MDHAKLPVMAWRNLWRNRRRTLLTLSRSSFGFFFAILLTGRAGHTAGRQMINLAARMGGGHVTLAAPRVPRHATFSRSARSPACQDRAAERTPMSTGWSNGISGPAMLATASETASASLFIAYDPRAEDEDTPLGAGGGHRGRAFSSSRKDRGIILGAKLAQNLGVVLGRQGGLHHDRPAGRDRHRPGAAVRHHPDRFAQPSTPGCACCPSTPSATCSATPRTRPSSWRFSSRTSAQLAAVGLGRPRHVIWVARRQRCRGSRSSPSWRASSR